MLYLDLIFVWNYKICTIFIYLFFGYKLMYTVWNATTNKLKWNVITFKDSWNHLEIVAHIKCLAEHQINLFFSK